MQSSNEMRSHAEKKPGEGRRQEDSRPRRRDRSSRERVGEEDRDREISARRDVEKIGAALKTRRWEVRQALADYLQENREVLRKENITRAEVQGWVQVVETHVEKWINDIEASWPRMGEEEFEAATMHVRDCLRALLQDKSVLRRLRLQSVKESCSSLSERDVKDAVKKLSALPRVDDLLRSVYALENIHLKTLVVAAAAASAAAGSAGLGLFLARHPEWWPAGYPSQDRDTHSEHGKSRGKGDDARDLSPAEIAAKEAAERKAQAAAGSRLQEETQQLGAQNAQAIAEAQHAREKRLRHEENMRHEQKGRDKMAGSTTLWNNWSYWAPFIQALATGAPYLSSLFVVLGVGGAAATRMAGNSTKVTRRGVIQPEGASLNPDTLERAIGLINRERPAGVCHVPRPAAAPHLV